MVNPGGEVEDEMEEDEAEEATRPKKKKKRVTNNGGGETTSSKPHRKTGRSKDPVWVHAEELKGNRFQCKYCGRIFSGGASRIKAHLGKEGHKGGVAICKKLPSSSELEAAEKDTGNPSSSEESDNQVPDPNPNPNPNPSTPQFDHHDPMAPLSPNPTSPQPACETTDTREHYKALVKHGLMNGLPVLSNPPTIFNESLRSLQNEVEEYVKKVKESWSVTGCSVKYHFRKKAYEDFPQLSDRIGCTVYSCRGIIFLNNKQMADLKVDEAVTFVLHELEPKGTSGLFCFSAFNDDFETKLLCPPTLILELLQRISERCDWISDLLKNAKAAFEFLERKGTPIEAPKFQHPFLELQAIMPYREDLGSDFLNPNTTSLEKFWEDAKEVLSAIGPLVQILDLFDSFVPNIGYFYEAMKKAKKRIKHHYKADLEKFQVLRELFVKLKHLVINEIHVITAFLNPGYMYKEAVIEDEIQAQVREFMKNYLVKPEEDEAFENELAIYSKRNPSLFTKEAISMLKEYHPVTWWEKFGGNVPILYRNAIRLLGQPSNCLSHLRHKPKFELRKFEELDLLRLNATMMEEFNRLGSSRLFTHLHGHVSHHAMSLMTKEYNRMMATMSVGTNSIKKGLSYSSAGMDPKGVSRMCTDPFPYIDDVPNFILPYIVGWTDVISDGNCGFRVIAEAGFGGEDQWPLVRTSMANEILAHQDRYVHAYFGNPEDMRQVVERINGHMRGPASRHHWLETPTDLFAAATLMNVMWVNLATVPGVAQHTTESCVSILPLRAAPSMTGPQRICAIAHVCKNHYILIHLRDQCPLPRIDIRWAAAKEHTVVGWDESFAARIEQWCNFRPPRRG